MPPRYAYWTILIDGKATAFRARERDELLPTFHQLARKNRDIVMRYFSKGRLWDSPEQAQWAGRNVTRPAEKRGADWRPGGRHEDPRARFAKRPPRDAKSWDTNRPPREEKRSWDPKRPPRDDTRGPGTANRPPREQNRSWDPKRPPRDDRRGPGTASRPPREENRSWDPKRPPREEKRGPWNQKRPSPGARRPPWDPSRPPRKKR